MEMTSVEISIILKNPYEVYEALLYNSHIKKWHKFISNHYLPPRKKKLLLFYPCSAKKPYFESRSYRMLFKTLSKLGKRRSLVHVITISEPFALVPEEFYNSNSKWHNWEKEWYDCPGLFEWWCRKYHEPYSVEYVNKCIDLLSDIVASFFKNLKVQPYYSRLNLIGFVRSMSSSLKVTQDHTHRLILERAAKRAGVNVKIFPTKRFVKHLVKKRGRLAWDFYGVAHPLSQRYLLKILRRFLK